MTNLKQLSQGFGTVTDILADNGYFSEGNVTLCDKNGVILYIAVKRDKHHPSLMERFQKPGPLPDDADSVDAMTHRLKAPSGKSVYALVRARSSMSLASSSRSWAFANFI